MLHFKRVSIVEIRSWVGAFFNELFAVGAVSGTALSFGLGLLCLVTPLLLGVIVGAIVSGDVGDAAARLMSAPSAATPSFASVY
ncbi:MAG: hypothetical protein ABI601_08570, partial [bacterium]